MFYTEGARGLKQRKHGPLPTNLKFRAALSIFVGSIWWWG